MRRYLSTHLAVAGIVLTVSACAMGQRTQDVVAAQQVNDFKLSCDQVQVERLKHHARIARLQKTSPGEQVLGAVNFVTGVVYALPFYLIEEANKQEPIAITSRRRRIARLEFLEDRQNCKPMTDALIKVALAEEEREAEALEAGDQIATVGGSDVRSFEARFFETPSFGRGSRARTEPNEEIKAVPVKPVLVLPLSPAEPRRPGVVDVDEFDADGQVLLRSDPDAERDRSRAPQTAAPPLSPVDESFDDF